MSSSFSHPGPGAPASAEFSPTERTRVRRHAERGSYDRALVHAILDEALVCHVGFVHEGAPFVIPTSFVRVDEVLYVHGAVANRMLGTLAGAPSVCVTVTLLDGLVLARSFMYHSMNYRSVVVLGTARDVTDPDEKSRAFAAMIDRVEPGRSGRCRPPNAAEFKATHVLALPLVEVSAKVRSGPPLEEEIEQELPCWAGVIPLKLTPGEAIPIGPTSGAAG